MLTEKICILIADDESINHFYYQEILSEDKYEIIFASNGIEAIQALKDNSDKISIILMDIKMPEMDGYTATKEIRKFNTTIPILAQTAYAFNEDIEKVLAAGCNDYISKPIHEDILISKIADLTKAL